MSRLHHAKRLSRLMLVASLICLWLVALSEHVIQQGLTATIDRASRNDRSIFRLGFDWLTRQTTQQQAYVLKYLSRSLYRAGRGLPNKR